MISRNNVAKVALGVVVSSAIPLFQAVAAPVGKPPNAVARIDGAKLAVMIRRTLHAFNQANLTNNYSVFHGLAAPGFRNVNSPQTLSATFAKMRARMPDVTALLATQPKLMRYPGRDKLGRLHLMGRFASNSQQIGFRRVYVPTQRGFALFAISVTYRDIRSAQPLRGAQPDR